MIGRFVTRYFSRNKHLREALKGTVALLIIRSLSVLLNFGLVLAIARTVGVDGSGAYFFSLSIVSMLSVLSVFGLDNTLLRLFSKYLSQKQPGVLRDIFNKSIYIVILQSVLILSILYFGVDSLLKPDDGVTSVIKVMSFSIVPLSLIALFSGILRGFNKPVMAFLNRNFFIALITITVILVKDIVKTEEIAFIYVMACYATLFLSTINILKLPVTNYLVTDRYSVSELIRFSSPIFIVALTEIIINSSGNIILGIYADNRSVGLFNAAYKVSLVVTFVLVCFNSASANKYSEIHAKGDVKLLSEMLRKFSILISLTSLPLVLAIIIFPGYIMGLFGEDFKEAESILIILTIAQFINVITGSVGMVLMMTGNQTIVRTTYIVYSILNLIMLIIFVPYYGIEAAAIVSSAVIIGINIVLGYQVYKTLNIITLPLPAKIVRLFWPSAVV